MRNILKGLLFSLLAVPVFAQEKIELNRNWEFRRADETRWRSATVPGTVHTDLLHHQLIPDPFAGANEKGLQWIDKKDWEYQCTFDVTPALLEHDVLALDFTGLDTYADVYLNDVPVLKARNMFVGKEVMVKPHLKAGRNHLRIYFHSPVAYDMPKFLAERLVYPAGNDASDIPLSIYARKAPYHYGWDWGPRYVTSGIWRPVYLKAWNKVQLQDSWLRQQSLGKDAAAIDAELMLNVQQAGTYRLLVMHEKGTKELTRMLQPGTQKITIPFTIRKPELWWPNGLGAQRLYNIKIAVLQGKDTLQQQQRRIGLRTIAVRNERDAQGTSFTVVVNGHPVFMKGTNYIPSDNFLPRVTEQRYRKMFADMQASHFNMVRVWGGGIYENDLFYDLADEKGILVWQDFMFACTLYPSDSGFLEQVKEEAAYNIRRLRNHPSLALWCGNNEVAVAIKNWGWKEGYAYTDEQWAKLLNGYETLFQDLLRQEVATHDPGRFYFPSSPISNWGKAEDFLHGDNHYWGVWHGMEWFEAFTTHVPRFMSEYGFQSFPDIHTVRRYADTSQWNVHSYVMQAHQKSFTRGNAAIQTYMEHYYHTPKDFPSFLYLSQVLQAEGMKTGMEAHRRAMGFCMGTLYWQFNDCWPGASWSGIDYYGRWKALQYYVKKAYAPLLASTVQENGKVSTYVVNDYLTGQTLTLDMRLTDLNGRLIWEKQVPVKAKANTSAVAHSIKRNEMLKGEDSTRVILYTKLLKDNKVVSDNVFYFAAPRQMPLPDATVQVLAEEKNGVKTLRLKSSQLARNVYLLLNGDNESHFSDNYFDLLPGQETAVTVQTALPLEEVKKQLQVQHLANTYR